MKERTVLFLPGPVGLQLELSSSKSSSRSDHRGSRLAPVVVVRFDDGGPHEPGPARASGKIQPGDWVTKVECRTSNCRDNGNDDETATTYSEIMRLLQKTEWTRRVTVRSAWDEDDTTTTASTTASTTATDDDDDDDDANKDIMPNNNNNTMTPKNKEHACRLDSMEERLPLVLLGTVSFPSFSSRLVPPSPPNHTNHPENTTPSSWLVELQKKKKKENPHRPQEQQRTIRKWRTNRHFIGTPHCCFVQDVDNDDDYDYDHDHDSLDLDERNVLLLLFRMRRMAILMEKDTHENEFSHDCSPPRSNDDDDNDDAEPSMDQNKATPIENDDPSPSIPVRQTDDDEDETMLPPQQVSTVSSSSLSPSSSMEGQEEGAPFEGMVHLQSSYPRRKSTSRSNRFPAVLVLPRPQTKKSIMMEEDVVVQLDERLGVHQAITITTPPKQHKEEAEESNRIVGVTNNDAAHEATPTILNRPTVTVTLDPKNPDSLQDEPDILMTATMTTKAVPEEYKQPNERSNDERSSSCEGTISPSLHHDVSFQETTIANQREEKDTRNNNEILRNTSHSCSSSSPAPSEEDVAPVQKMELQEKRSSLEPATPSGNTIQSPQQQGESDMLQKAKAKQPQIPMARVAPFPTQFQTKEPPLTNRRKMEQDGNTRRPNNNSNSNPSSEHKSDDESSIGKSESISVSASVSVSQGIVIAAIQQPVCTTETLMEKQQYHDTPLSEPKFAPEEPHRQEQEEEKKKPVAMRTMSMSQFAAEQALILEPGSVGLQLEESSSQHSEYYAAKVARFVDGGPRNPGQARNCGKIRPGDFIVRVEAEGVVATTYPDILQLLLQKSWTTRTLIFRSAWDDPAMFGTPNEERPSKRQEGAKSHATYCPVQEQPSKKPPRASPYREKSPLRYDRTPALPDDWVHKTPIKPLTQEENVARQKAYEEEANWLIQEQVAKRKTIQEQQLTSQWSFQDVLLGAVAVTAESVVGCLRKKHDDADDDEDYHEKGE
jgi:hypothetical protein